MGLLLGVTAIVEEFAGLVFEVAPSQLTGLLFSTSLSTPVELIYARSFGVALLALAVACWFTRKHEPSQMLRGVVGGVLVFDPGIVMILSYANIVLGLSSTFLWPFILVHLALAIWCSIGLLKKG